MIISRWRQLTMPSSPLLHLKRSKHHVAIVGSGPSGFYSAKYLLEKHPQIHVDMIEKLPTPYGLVRYGVAPDHQETKNVMNTFSEVAKNPRFRYFGNVEVGPIEANNDITSHHQQSIADHHNKISIDSLQKAYKAVILAYGASSDALLNIPGERQDGVFSAREFVNWYNGHPEYSHLTADISLDKVKHVVVIGHGNVAIDCGRVLAKDPIHDLQRTDILSYAIESLQHSPIERITIIGRRGHVQSSFSIKEFREITKLSTASLIIHKDEIERGMTNASQEELNMNRAKQRISDLIHTIANNTSTPIEKRKILEMRFLLNPFRLESNDEGRVKSVVVERCLLQGPAGKQKAIPDPNSELMTIPCDLVLKSVGFRSEPMLGIPFDDRSCTIPHVQGRVIKPGQDGYMVSGLYVTGWLKRGPTGIIGTNIPDAKETVMSVLDDLANQNQAESDDDYDPMHVVPGLTGDTVVSWQGYMTLEQHELLEGKACVPPRVRCKVPRIEEMLKYTHTTN